MKTKTKYVEQDNPFQNNITYIRLEKKILNQ